MKLTKKIGIGVASIIFVIGICVGFTQNVYTDVYSEFKQVEYETMPVALDLLEIENDVQEIRGWTISYIITGNVDVDGKSITESLQDALTALETKRNAFVEPESLFDMKAQRKAEEIDSLIAQLVSTTMEVVDQKNHGAGMDELTQLMDTAYQPTFSSLVTLLHEQKEQHQADLGKAGMIVDAGYARGIWLIRFSGIVGVASSIGIVYLLTRVSFKAFDHVNHLTQTLTAISSIDRLTVDEKNRDQLMQRSCELMTKSMGYDGVWIGLADNTGRLTSVTAAGIDITSYFEYKRNYEEFSITSTPCARESRVQLVSGESHVCAGCPIKIDDEECDILCTRLYHEDNMYGMIMASMSKEVAQPYAVAYFEEAASTLGHAIRTIDNETEQATQAKLLDNSIDAIILHDVDGNISYFNEVAHKNLGYTRHELTSLNLSDLFRFEEGKLPFSLSSLTEGVIKHDASSITKQNESIPTELHVKPLTLGSEKMFLTIMRDNSDKKMVEDELQTVTQHLSELVEEKEREIVEAEKITAIPVIEDTVKYANEKIEEYRVLSNKLKTGGKSVGLESFLVEIVEVYPDVHLDLQTDIVEWGFDADKIRSVIDKLLNNALDAVTDGGDVSLSIDSENGVLEVSVFDTGRGISEDALSSLFTNVAGTGLPYCKNTIEELGGRISVESKLGVGSIFTLHLPDNKEIREVITIDYEPNDGVQSEGIDHPTLDAQN